MRFIHLIPQGWIYVVQAPSVCSLQLCSALAAGPLGWLGTWGPKCFLHVPAWFLANVLLKWAAFIPPPHWKYLHHGSSWVWITLFTRLTLIVFVLEMNTVIFLAAFIKSRLLKSSSMLPINFFDAASTLQCCHARFSFFFFFTVLPIKPRKQTWMPCHILLYSQSKKRTHWMPFILLALILRLKRSKKPFRTRLQNYWTFTERLYRDFFWLQEVVLMPLASPHPSDVAASQLSRHLRCNCADKKYPGYIYEEWKGKPYPWKSSWTLTVGLDLMGCLQEGNYGWRYKKNLGRYFEDLHIPTEMGPATKGCETLVGDAVNNLMGR